MKRLPFRVMVTFGTRPEVIKLAPVTRELQRRAKDFALFVCATAQHRQLTDQFTESFRLPIHYDLNVMKPGQNLGDLTARIISKISPVLSDVRPDVVIVQGDTTTAFVATLAAFYQRIPVAHVEAGLRTNDRFAPFPEEMNRRLTAQMAEYHFAPTAWARDNLLREGVSPSRVFVTGNTVIDAFLDARRQVTRQNPAICELDGLKLGRRKLILVTAHRRENFGAGIAGVCTALRKLVQGRDDIEVVYPVHPNPNVRCPVFKALSGVAGIHLISPPSYLAFVSLASKSYMVLTDSGGLQEEIPTLGVPVLVLRENTERPEGVDAGVCRLVGTNPQAIFKAVTDLLDNRQAYNEFARKKNPFGDGKAAVRVVEYLFQALKGGTKNRSPQETGCSDRRCASSATSSALPGILHG